MAPSLLCHPRTHLQLPSAVRQILENQKRLEEERNLARKEVAAEIEALIKQLRESEREVARKDTRLEKELKAGRHLEAALEQARLQIKAFETDHSKTRDELQARRSGPSI